MSQRMLVLRVNRSKLSVPYGEHFARDSISFEVMTSDEPTFHENTVGVEQIAVHTDETDGTVYTEDHGGAQDATIGLIGDWMMAATAELLKEEPGT